MKKMIVCAVMAGLFSGVASAKENTFVNAGEASFGANGETPKTFVDGADTTGEKAERGAEIGGIYLGSAALLTSPLWATALYNKKKYGTWTKPDDDYINIYKKAKPDIDDYGFGDFTKVKRFVPGDGEVTLEYLKTPKNEFGRYGIEIDPEHVYQEEKSDRMEEQMANEANGGSLEASNSSAAEELEAANTELSQEINKNAIGKTSTNLRENENGEEIKIKDEVKENDPDLAKELEEGAEGAE